MMRKIRIGSCFYNVSSSSEYTMNRNVYNPRFTAVECHGGDYALPVNSRATDTTPGVYYYPNNGMCGVVVKPEDHTDYTLQGNPNYINYGNAQNVSDVVKMNKMVRDIQNEIITTSDNILQLNISDEDTPEMRALKLAINAKGVDKKQYEDRFDQFQNDMRLLKGHSITLGKLISICGAFDINVDLTLSDKPNVPNPIGEEINIELTEGRPK